MARKDITDLQIVQLTKQWRTEYSPEDSPGLLYDYIAKHTGQHWKVAWVAMERAYNRKYLDYGVSLRTAWITPEGQQLLDS